MRWRVYLDVCCLNRPLDDQTQARIRLETEAVEHLLRAVELEELIWVSSEIVLYEVGQCPNEERRNRVLALCGSASETLRVDRATVNRARALLSEGLRPLDALHLACAEHGTAQVLLTTDDRFVSAVERLKPASPVRVLNPVDFEEELLGWTKRST